MANRLSEFEDILLDLCKASLAAPDKGANARACGQLIKEFVAKGPKKLVESQTQTPGPNEYRLNGAGLKLEFNVEIFRDSDGPRVYVGKFRIGGDQVEQYPAFVQAAQPILESANGGAGAEGGTRRAA